ncbi:hypothetical protein J2S43_004195 [Catenuloplanes nepalensis]|uniref:Uncharacterized protein n=1 Tax=Catenuloplanes nepalensis TaxID=587533 RepID=A0ABT9MW62_9ACTN|nr:hypothetical protein [Catenuloplanes nepalensis]MDP9795683.1 hypothetical protein [Catenuloplanes nepalensis]
MDGYGVTPRDVLSLAGTTARQRQPVMEASAPLQRAVSSVSTGDPALDAHTRAVAAEVEELHRRLAAVLGLFGDALRDAVTAYTDGDEEVAADFRTLATPVPAVPGAPGTAMS